MIYGLDRLTPVTRGRFWSTELPTIPGRDATDAILRASKKEKPSLHHTRIARGIAHSIPINRVRRLCIFGRFYRKFSESGEVLHCPAVV